MTIVDNPEINAPEIKSTVELLAHVLAVETEAGERYAEIAQVMDAHNNTELAKLFRQLADIEELHAENVRRKAAEQGLGELPVLDYNWQAPEGPETASFDDLHYKMTPRHALQLARHNEERAVDYFAAIAEQVNNEEIRAMALDMVEDEREHVQLLDQWLAKLPQLEEDWDEDLDEPVGQD